MARETPHIQQWLALTHTVGVYTRALNAFAAQFARRLPNISALDIHDDENSNDHTNIHPSTFAVLSSFHSVTTLSLLDCKFKTFSDFQILIRAFPKLSALIWGDCSCVRTPRLGPLINTHPTRPRLISLLIPHGDTYRLERSKLYLWLSRSLSTTNTIRSMYLSFPIIDEDDRSVDSLVEAIGPSLTELRFAVYSMSF